MDSPPAHAGLYALTNRVTGQLYIGRSTNLRRRYSEWKAVFVSGLGHKNKEIFDALSASGPENWAFGVLFDFPLMSETELAKREKRAIAHAKKTKPGMVLNCILPTPILPALPRVGSTPKSVVLDVNGKRLSHRQVANALQVTRQAVKKRLKAYRDRGVFEIQMADWGQLHGT